MQYYEHLRSDLRGALHEIFTFYERDLGLVSSRSVDGSVACALNRAEGTHRRKKKGLYNPYKKYPGLVALVCNATKEVWNEEMWGACDGTLQAERAAERTALAPSPPPPPMRVCEEEEA